MGHGELGGPIGMDACAVRRRAYIRVAESCIVILALV